MLTMSLIALVLAAEPAGILGDWKVTAVEGTGLAKALKDNVSRMVIDAKTITAGRPASYTLDAKQKTIDMTIDAGPKEEQGKYFGIYEMKDGELKLHFALPGKDRPSGFTAGESSFVITLKK